MMQFCELIRTFKRDERGGTAILVAPIMIVIAGMAALVLDTAQAYTLKEQLLTTAEAAAAAAVSTLPDRSSAHEMALNYAKLNVRGSDPEKVVTANDVQIGYWNKSLRTFTPKSASEPANAVRITASRVQAKGNALPTFFGNVLGMHLFDVSVTVVAMRYDGQPCINALAPDGIGVKVNSNAAINTSNCPIHIHSAANDALSVDANASVTAQEICIKGGYQLMSKATAQPVPETSCPAPAQDPFANVVPPSFGAHCDYTNTDLDGKTVTLNPGVYCGGLTVRGKSMVTFNPGEYIIKDGLFTIDSNSTAVGNGVMFYLTGSTAVLDFESNVTVNFTARSDGPRAGIVFFQDRAYGGVHTFNSNVNAIINGTVYFPKATLDLNSNSQIDTASSCLMIVTYRVNLDSNVAIESNSNVQSTTDSSLCPAPSNTRRSRIVA
jgi:Flp pilus assembly protein TadG